MAKSIGFNIVLSVNGQRVVVNCKKGVDDLGKALGTIPGAARKAGNALQTMGAISTSLRGVYESVSGISQVVSQLTGAYRVQEEAELKLDTVMRQRMNANDAMVNSIKSLASQQQQLGVIGDEVQLAGAQQVATFLSQKESIEELLPAMNNLAVQRKGLNVTAEDMVNIGNLVGKVMQGNVGALTRVGITFSEADKQAIKFGTEQQRAAALAKIITNNVGEMNAQLANTDAGRAKQMANAFGDIQENLGKSLQQYEVLIQALSQFGMIATGVTQLGSAIIGVTQAMYAWTNSTVVASVNHKIASAAVRAFTSAVGMSTVSIAGATTAIRVLTFALRTLEVASVIGAVVAALSVVFEQLYPNIAKTTEETDNLTEAQRRQAEEAQRVANRNAQAAQAVGRQTGNLVGKYKTLQAQWNNLKTAHEKNQWIKKNQSAFGELGASVKNVNEAYSFFVKNSSRVIEALRAIAETRAWEGIHQKDVEELETARRSRTVDNGAYYTTHKAGEEVRGSDPERKYVKLGKGDYYHTYENAAVSGTYLTEAGAKKYNQAAAKIANARRRDYLATYEKNERESEEKMEELQQKALKITSALGMDMNGNGGASDLPQPSQGRTGGRTGRGTTPTPEPEKPLTWIENPKDRADYEQNSKYLQQEIDNLDAANAADAARIKLLQGKKDVVDQIIDKYTELEKVEAQKPQDDKLADADKFEAGSLADYEAQLQRVNDDLRTRNVSGRELLDLLRQQAALQAIVDRMQSQRGQGKSDEEANPFDVQIEAVRQERDRIYDMFEDDIELDVDIKLQGDIDKLDKELADLIKKKRQWDKANRKKQKGNEWQSTTEQIDKLGAAAQNMSSAFSQMGDDTAAAILQVAAATASATAEIIPQIMQLIGAKEGEALASGMAEGAKVPFPGNIAAIATIVASIMGVIATIGSVTGGFATGGIVPGTSYRGDRLTARVNSGEMILTARQQARLFQIADGSLMPRVAYPSVGFTGSPSVDASAFAGGGLLPTGRILWRLKGRDLVAVAANETRIGGKIGRRSNITI